MLSRIPGSFPCGRIFGIPIRLHVFFILLLLAQTLGSLHNGASYMLLWFILMGPVLLLTILVHELGHCLAARQVGGEVQGILLWPLGGLAFIGHTAGPKADMWVAVAGPLTHVPMVIIWLLLLLPVYHADTGSWSITLQMPYPDSGHLWHAVCVGAIIMNISLFAFNLLVPAYPLDGGRILVDLLLAMGVGQEATAKITIGTAVPLALGIMVWGFWQFQMVTIMVAAFILWSTYQLFAALRGNMLGAHPLFAFSGEEASGGTYFKFQDGV